MTMDKMLEDLHAFLLRINFLQNAVKISKDKIQDRKAQWDLSQKNDVKEWERTKCKLLYEKEVELRMPSIIKNLEEIKTLSEQTESLIIDLAQMLRQAKETVENAQKHGVSCKLKPKLDLVQRLQQL